MIGNCFEAAFKYLMDQCEDPKNYLLVHGEVIGTGGSTKGLKYGHAWLESKDGKICIDVTNGRHITIPKVIYYAVGNIYENVYRYTWTEARQMANEHKHYGPWELVTETGL